MKNKTKTLGLRFPGVFLRKRIGISIEETQGKVRPELKVKFLSKILDILHYFTDYNNDEILVWGEC